MEITDKRIEDKLIKLTYDLLILEMQLKVKLHSPGEVNFMNSESEKYENISRLVKTGKDNMLNALKELYGIEK